MRIVSLIASATEIVHALGLGDLQVGRSHECDYPESVRELPVCTAPAIDVNGSSADIDRRVRERITTAVSVYDVFTDVLDRLAPTHIITQTHCKVCAVSLDDVERALAASVSSRPRLVALEPNALEDIWSGIRNVASACGVPDRGEELVANLQKRMRTTSERAHAAPRRPRVACVEWNEPLMAAGNWVPELLEMANGENLFGRAGQHSPWMTWSELLDADPDIILISPCGFDLERTRNEMYWLTNRPEWGNLRAVQKDSVYLIDGNQYMNRPGPRVADSLDIIAEILHPGAFAPQFETNAWERWTQVAAVR